MVCTLTINYFLSYNLFSFLQNQGRTYFTLHSPLSACFSKGKYTSLCGVVPKLNIN